MDCDFEEFEPARADGWRRLRCRRADCRFIMPHTPDAPRDCHNACRSRVAIAGFPGTSLHRLRPKEGCGCGAMIAQMNAWGVEGCRRRRREIIAHLKQAYGEATLLTKLTAFGQALANGLPLTLAGLVDEALRRAV
jgi:hypothetical protein